MFITYQSANINGKDVVVTPVNQDSLFNILNNPFKGPNNNRVISISEEGKVILYSNNDITKYYAKYLSKPYPIILEGVAAEDGEFTINDKTESKEITWLPESLHNQILVRAVQIAKSVWAS